MKIRVKVSLNEGFHLSGETGERIESIRCRTTDGSLLNFEAWGQEWDINGNTIDYRINAVDVMDDAYPVSDFDIWVDDIAYVESIEFADSTLSESVESVSAVFENHGKEKAMPTNYGIQNAFSDYLKSIDLRDYQDAFGSERLENELSDYAKKANIKSIGGFIDILAEKYISSMENRGAFDH